MCGDPFLFIPLNAKLNPICHFLAHHILHFSRVRVKYLQILLDQRGEWEPPGDGNQCNR